MRLNLAQRAPAGRTHEGAPGAHLNIEQQLRRSVLSCLLWEREFYEDGVAIADRIEALAAQVPPGVLADLAVEARSTFKLRHAPLLLLTVLAKTGAGKGYAGLTVADAIEQTIQRADELTELLAIYWRGGKRPLSKQMKLGLAQAFRKFDAYQLAKYNRANAVRLRDVLFLSHAKPKDEAQAALWKQMVDGELAAPDTWEVALSAGADKKATFERLIAEGQLGYLALLRNLRNMAGAGCDPDLVREAIVARKGAHRVLPFRYVAAARAAPQFEPALDQALSEAIAALPVLPGKTVVLVDTSPSMEERLSARSDLTRMDAAGTLASMIPGDLRVFAFSNAIAEVPPRRGMAGLDAIVRAVPRNGTLLGAAIRHVNEVGYDRLIVITDEQSQDAVGAPLAGKRAYMLNVASAQNGVGYGPWVRINGFSEAVLTFIGEHERAGS
jgi:hypothetical protein